MANNTPLLTEYLKTASELEHMKAQMNSVSDLLEGKLKASDKPVFDMSYVLNDFWDFFRSDRRYSAAAYVFADLVIWGYISYLANDIFSWGLTGFPAIKLVLRFFAVGNAVLFLFLLIYDHISVREMEVSSLNPASCILFHHNPILQETQSRHALIIASEPDALPMLISYKNRGFCPQSTPVFLKYSRDGRRMLSSFERLHRADVSPGQSSLIRRSARGPVQACVSRRVPQRRRSGENDRRRYTANVTGAKRMMHPAAVASVSPDTRESEQKRTPQFPVMSS